MDHVLSLISHHVIYDMMSISNAFHIATRSLLCWWFDVRVKWVFVGDVCVRFTCLVDVSMSKKYQQLIYILRRLININRNEKDFDDTFARATTKMPTFASCLTHMPSLNVKPLWVSSFARWTVYSAFETNNFVNYCIWLFVYWMYLEM